ncbi:class I SAM-dependent methyltransferase [Botrimarina mediterranea]|uniref:Methyltransferase domain protein n=1 Tax=Botrimarina mediterranea TaxID=2528022 RepID=A0A518K9I8_9BACT|nr:class I SAM-dependent methyltransferase [Botrimarina mediterranea]QDV74451.1 Methyltransferase domain protein [Botrimarina mediterranea]QDV79047.1 Methyltransferase domain protein [Planctomycetes bacterium K2D]
MKVRDSGMPEETYWESLFDIPAILAWMNLDHRHSVAELGCGFGTFTIPIAKAIDGVVHAFDIDPVMLARTSERAASLRVECRERDVLADGFGVRADRVLLFNILHCDHPVRLLRLAAEALNLEGQIHVIHWQHRDTPRGPDLSIRPAPQQVIEWASEAGLSPVEEARELPPWHYGIKLRNRPISFSVETP